MHDACWLHSLQGMLCVYHLPLSQTGRSRSQWGDGGGDECSVVYQRFGFA